MAVDSDLSITSLVTEALKAAGRVNPSATMISDATSLQFRMVKSDLAVRSGRHAALLDHSVTITTDGLQRYAWPTAAHEIQSVQILDGPDEWRGTAQTGTSTTLTLAADLDQSDATALKGKYLVTLGGTGSEQIRQITGWDNATKIATVDSAWSTTPDSTTTYLVASDHRHLWETDKTSVWNTNPIPGARGRAYTASMFGRQLWLDTTPDKAYVLWWNYWAHMDRLDNTGSVILSHIREHYSLWHQGLVSKLNQRYDEDRYQVELSVYNAMLLAYEQEGSTVSVIQPFDV